MVVGLTGGIGTGKTTVAKLFSNFKNCAVYIADDEAKKLMHSSTEIRNEVIKEFGDESYVNEQLNRKYISEIVFKNPDKLSKLNKIVHPVVRQHFLDFKENNKNKDYILYEAAILFEAKADILCDKIISVFVDKKTRFKRVMQRDSVTETEVKKRMKNQWKEEKKQLLSHYLIYNTSIEETEIQVRRIHNFLTKSAV